jgi:hypothetical protein
MMRVVHALFIQQLWQVHASLDPDKVFDNVEI